VADDETLWRNRSKLLIVAALIDRRPSGWNLIDISDGRISYTPLRFSVVRLLYVVFV
jgi:hypothetical protein